MNEEQIHLILREYLANGRSHSWKEKGNKYYHGLRTAVLAKKLRQTLFPQDQEADPVLTVASLSLIHIFNPEAPVHFLVIPKKHIASAAELRP